VSADHPAPGVSVPRRYDLSCRVDSYRDGWKLLRFLSHRFRYHPEERWSERLAGGAVRVNGSVAAADTPVHCGDLVEYTLVHTEPAVDPSYEVLFEDDHLLAVSKSGNLPVHAGGKYIRHTLISLLRERWGRELRLAHRLDRETSGVVLLAKDAAAARALERQFHQRRVHKLYLAVLRGETPPEWTVDAALARREPAEPPYFRVVDAAAGKPSLTRFRRRAVGSAAAGTVSLVEAEPVTGRTNQIRVHAAHAGYPVLGDKIYGVPEELAREFVAAGETPQLLAAAGAARHLLHCARLALEHPRTGMAFVAEAPLPGDIVGLFPDGIGPA